ncbi:MAG: hypothetical protein QXV82_09745 [Ignisphaera sp.]
MAYAPPSAYSVHDIVLALAEIIPQKIIVPTRAIADAMNMLINNFWNWVLNPIITAIGGAISFLFEVIGSLLNSAYQSLVNFIYLFIINPLKALVQDILNRLYSKLEGVIFIAITVPAMIIQGKMLMEKPSLKGVLLFMLKPLIGAAVAKVVAEIIKPALRPVTIEPSVPPSVIMVPPPKEVGITPYDSIMVDDSLILEIQPPMSFLDTARVEDVLTLEALPPMSFLDFVGIEDMLNIEVIPPLALSDSVTVEDILDIEVIPPLALTDSVTVEDTLIIGLG